MVNIMLVSHRTCTFTECTCLRFTYTNSFSYGALKATWVRSVVPIPFGKQEIAADCLIMLAFPPTESGHWTSWLALLNGTTHDSRHHYTKAQLGYTKPRRGIEQNYAPWQYWTSNPTTISKFPLVRVSRQKLPCRHHLNVCWVGQTLDPVQHTDPWERGTLGT